MEEETAPAAASFLALDRVHAELDELFLLHQEALLAGDLPRAEARLGRFEACLRVHMRHEEEWLLPLFEERRVGRSGERSAGAEVYRLEHARMLELLAGLRAGMRELAAGGAPRPRDVLALLALLDRGLTFKHLVEHHDTREHIALYPELDRLTTPEERRELSARCAREWATVRSAGGPTVG